MTSPDLTRPRPLYAQIRSLRWADARERLSRARGRLEVRTADRRTNRRWVTGTPRFLMLRHAGKTPNFYDIVLQWVEENVPELRRLFELRLLPCWVGDWSRYALLVPWLQDPVEAWSRPAYARALRLSTACDRRGIPVINRVERLRNATKAEGARRISAVGLRTPAMRVIDDAREFRETGAKLALPLFVREDAGHGGALLRADTEDELRALPVERFRRPVAVELIDLKDPRDGLYRKFRYVVAGRVGLPHHMPATETWVTRGEIRFHSAATRSEEEAYIGEPNPHHDLFQRARRALGLDLVAFDYGLDRRGKPIVWEANPFPHFHMPQNRLAYLAPAMHRTLAAMVHLYLERAGLPIPAPLHDLLFTSPAVSVDDSEQVPVGTAAG